MKTLLQWVKVNSVILVNAGSLVGSMAVTSVLGFAYWWLAARQFSPEAVGLASATISAMTLLGGFGTLGLDTLLLGELPQQRGKEVPLISGTLLFVGGVGGCLGIVFAAVVPYFLLDFQALRANIGNIALFAVGVTLTAIILALDAALLGLLRANLQLCRNTLFAAAKLAALFIMGLWLSHVAGLTIYATWTIGNAFSLAALAGFVIVKGRRPGRSYLPQWDLLRKLSAALKHHVLNITLQAPPLILPLLVTALLSATVSGWFYISWNLAGIANTISAALTATLYVVGSAQPTTLARQIRVTLCLAVAACVVANCVLLFATKQVLELFGHSYAEQAAWSLRILALESFPFIIKNHYIVVSRIHGRVTVATLFTIATGLLELGASALGGHLGGLTGLSLGWLAAMCVEAVFMSRTVYKAAGFFKTSPQVSSEPLWKVSKGGFIIQADGFFKTSPQVSSEPLWKVSKSGFIIQADQLRRRTFTLGELAFSGTLSEQSSMTTEAIWLKNTLVLAAMRPDIAEAGTNIYQKRLQPDKSIEYPNNADRQCLRPTRLERFSSSQEKTMKMHLNQQSLQ